MDLCSHVYDPILKQLNKEMKQKVLKGDDTEGMQVDKVVMIPTTSKNPIDNASFNSAMSKVIEENIRTLSNQVKELQQKVIQLEGENIQLKE